MIIKMQKNQMKKKIFTPTPEQSLFSLFLKKCLAWGFITALLLFFVFAAVAEAIVSTSTVRQQIKDNREQLRDVRKETQQQIKDTRQEVKDTKQGARQAALEQIKQRRDELKSKINNVASSTKAAIAQKREALKTKIDERKAQLKEGLKLLKDERKKKIVERIDEQLRKLNERMTDHFLDVLTKLEKVLANISSRADKAAEAGKDVTAVRAAVTSAQAAIDAARATVQTQAGKLYNVTISGQEPKLKAEVGKARQTLHNDLAAVRKIVQVAREAVHTAATTLAQIPKIDDDSVSDDNSGNGSAASTNGAGTSNQ